MADDQFSGQTRREDQNPGTRHEGADPRSTRREEQTIGTRREDGATSPRRENASGGAETIIGLPPGLRGRYRVIDELPNPGAEADVLLVQDRQADLTDGNDRRVIKLYRRGIKADPAVWAAVRELSCPHVVRIVDSGTESGRDFEVMEFLPEGNLTELVPAAGVGVPAATVKEVVRQVTDGLAALHEHGVVHRDLKPENVLIRRREPLEVAVTDFGLSRLQQQTMVAASRSGTLAYLAPEVMLSTGAMSSRTRDWWALGMIARELLTGHRPFEQMTDAGIDRAVLLRGIDLGDIDDPRMLLLCRGLLIRDPDDRWGAHQVHEWLRGESPPVPDSAAPGADGIEPLRFDGHRHVERKALARAFARSWDKAARRFFASMGTPDRPSEAWQDLRHWLQQFKDPDADDVESLVDLIDQQLQPADIAPDVKVLALLRWLDPNLPPLYRGHPVDRAHLPALAAQAATAGAPEHRAALQVVRGLRERALLPTLAQMRGGDGLSDIDRRWRTLCNAYDNRLAEVVSRLSDEVRDQLDRPDQQYASLLQVALDDSHARRLRRTVDELALADPVGWFEDIRTQRLYSDDAIDAAVLFALYPAAARQAEQSAMARRQREEARRRLHEQWDRREQARLAGAQDTTGTAATAIAVCGAVMLVVFLLDLARGRTLNIVSAVVGLLVLGAAGWGEVAFAKKLGTDYADFAPFARAGTRMRGLGAQVRDGGVGRGLAGLLIGLAAVSIGTWLPIVPYVLLAGGYAWSVHRRDETWRVRHESEQRQALESP